MELRSITALVVLAAIASATRDLEMTIKVKAGVSECFYAPLQVKDEVEYDFQVLNGEYGDLDIDMFLFDEQGSILESESRAKEGSYRFTVTEAGDYKFCLDNSFSRVSAKTVFFAVYITNEENPPMPVLTDYSDRPWLEPEQMYEKKYEDVRNALTRIALKTVKTRHLQDGLKADMSRDRNIQENNFSKINFFSAVCVVVMVTTGLAQVVLLRSLFDDKSRLHQLWKSSN